ncbi:hypothetical protein N7510_001727 [Penicillium lagena]|uniref:uncharacterized protein n=1 Tax=Penicillium lagena TaxID=94218 RepID=UPI002540F209|nr:uncharacterized protein N7510_001727 [Penicillium lagena]KAJ5625418.1 hypothetical protein N7510_001727 [Penicillium lagena]
MQPEGLNIQTSITQDDRPGTPPRPPYSPVTPVFAPLAPVTNGEPSIIPPSSPSPTTRPLLYTGYPPQPPPPPRDPPVFKPEPPPVPISESENPDAIALRSALSILQLQKQQSLRDIQTLDRLKDAAAADPAGFARELAAGRLKTEDRGAVVQFSEEDDEEEKEGHAEGTQGPEYTQGSKLSADESKFGRIPPPQNVVRMPPINWAKYQVVGESLDRMHNEQLHRPNPGEPRRGEAAPEHVLASPYRPLVDKLETPARSSRLSKGKKL